MTGHRTGLPTRPTHPFKIDATLSCLISRLVAFRWERRELLLVAILLSPGEVGGLGRGVCAAKRTWVASIGIAVDNLAQVAGAQSAQRVGRNARGEKTGAAI